MKNKKQGRPGNYNDAYIIESVDSICRDSVDMQHNYADTKNCLKISKTAKKHRESTETEGPKCCSFFFFFRQASSNLCDSFTMVLAQNSSNFH